MTASLDLTASRNVDWAPTIDLFYEGEPLPLTGDISVSMEIRLYAGAPGTAIGGIPNMGSIDSLSEPGDPLPRRFRLFPVIPKENFATFPTGLNQPEPGEADIYSYDLILTYDDGAQDKLALGRFILEPGVTVTP